MSMTSVGPRVLVVSELYYPEQTSTGHYLTRIAESLASQYEVTAICAQPTYAARGHTAPWREVRNGVSIERCWTTRLDKNVLPFRLINAITVAASLGLRVLFTARQGDRVVVVTTPPLLPLKTWLPTRLRGGSLTLLVHDVYPDVLVSAGIIGRDGVVAGFLGAVVKWLS